MARWALDSGAGYALQMAGVAAHAGPALQWMKAIRDGNDRLTQLNQRWVQPKAGLEKVLVLGSTGRVTSQACPEELGARRRPGGQCRPGAAGDSAAAAAGHLDARTHQLDERPGELSGYDRFFWPESGLNSNQLFPTGSAKFPIRQASIEMTSMGRPDSS